jgi:hypothetical protein
MLRKIIRIGKLTLQMILVMAVGFALSAGIYISVQESIRAPTDAELRALDNISTHLDANEARTVKKSRFSILQVLSGKEDYDGFAKMSGTYLTHKDKYYVLTAAHGVMGECEYFYVATASEDVYDCIKYIVIDEHIDYALIEIEEVPQRHPLNLKDIVPADNQWKEQVASMSDIVYTGFPNGLGPLTFRGYVAGVSPKNYIYLHSYAWPGSSGAGVFGYDGKLIGIIIALNVGFTGAGYDVLEDLVIVTPLFMIDWDSAYQIMSESAPAGDTGDTGE